MKKRKWYSKGLVVVFVLVGIVLVGTACGARSPNPNAVWLEIPKEAEGWVPFKVKEQDGEYWVSFGLAKEAHLYFAETSQYFDATTISTTDIWVTPVENNNLWQARNKDWWDQLSPLTHEFRVEILEGKEHRARYLLEKQLGQGNAAFLYVRNGREWLAFWAPSFQSLNTVHEGRLRAAICYSYTTEEVTAWKAEH